MARAHYYVVPHNGAWAIKHNDKYYSYNTKAEAKAAAVDAAHKSGKQGHDAQVIVQLTNGQFQTEWTYGHDPYPPRG